MKQQAIGDATVTAVGVGQVDLSIAGARGLTISDVERALHDALELGITLIDSAPDERVERLCADAVRALRLRDRAIVATRVRALEPMPGRLRDVLPERLPPRYVQERVEAKLRATKLDALPLAFLPIRTAWCASKAWPELAGTCARLTREGKVLRWGVWLDLAAAERDERLAAELAEAAALRDPFVALSVVYNACDRRAEPLVRARVASLAEAAAVEAVAASDELLVTPPPGLLAAVLAAKPGDPLATVVASQIGSPAATENAPAAPQPRPLPILAREPLAGGALAGTLGPGVKLAPRDDRNAIDDATLVRIAVAIARLSELVRTEPPAARSCDAARAVVERVRGSKIEREALTVAELALRYVIDRGAIALPRLHRREHLGDALGVLVAPPLSADALERIEHALS